MDDRIIPIVYRPRQKPKTAAKTVSIACWAYFLMAVLAAVAPATVGHSFKGGLEIAHTENGLHGDPASPSSKHGHVHEDGDAEERRPGHIHGHNFLDHTHETPGMTGTAEYVGPHVFPAWTNAPVFPSIDSPSYLLERPPR